MKDKTITVVNSYDLLGQSIDCEQIGTLKDFLDIGTARVQAASVISSNCAEIVKRASAQLFEEQPELLKPGGNAYTTRRHRIYSRNIGYFLRYCSYALVAEDNSVLDDRLLASLRDTFNSLGISLASTARSIYLMKSIAKEKLAEAGIENTDFFVDEPFDYAVRNLSETDV